MDLYLGIGLTIIGGWPYYYFGLTGLIFAAAVYGTVILLVIRHRGLNARHRNRVAVESAPSNEATDLTLRFGFDRFHET